MINIRKEYQKYAYSLIKKGVSPSIVCIADIIQILTEDDSGKYNFNTDNIISGANGELIRIDNKNGIIEIYNSFMDDYFTLKLYDIETGELLDDGELGKEVNSFKSIVLYGYDVYESILDKIENDFSDCNREISKDRDNINIKMLELTNRLAKSKLLGLKDRVLKVANKYCKRNDYINVGVDKIIANINDAYHKHSQIKEFKSSCIEQETVDIINRKLYLDGLKEESEAYSKISIFPITEIIEEYQAYKAPKTDKIAKKYIFISNKINEVLRPFCDFRVDIRSHLLNSDEIEEISEKHRKLLLKRRDELDEANTWGLYD